MKIKELTILTYNLTNQIDFYQNVIGLKLLKNEKKEAKFRIGKSIFKLVECNSFQPYHFAINIPCNKENEALNWLKERVNILKDRENEIQDFSYWNAKAIYFYDTDKNIVEFIARKNLKNKSVDKFSARSLLEISEIGMPVSNIKSCFSTLKKITNVEIYDGGFEKFCAIGDEEGLFICINKNLKHWYPVKDKAHSSNFEMKMIVNNKNYHLIFKNGKIRSQFKKFA
tara:strand:+ start:6980 stop:7660 length:681 start_codon:yes stop_codon:yes gene_type:complete